MPNLELWRKALEPADFELQAERFEKAASRLLKKSEGKGLTITVKNLNELYKELSAKDKPERESEITELMKYVLEVDSEQEIIDNFQECLDLIDQDSASNTYVSIEMRGMRKNEDLMHQIEKEVDILAEDISQGKAKKIARKFAMQGDMKIMGISVCYRFSDKS
jgi:hypothetical protein